MIAARPATVETAMPDILNRVADVRPLLAWLCICAASAGMAFATAVWAGA
ncbi:hypothetical protein [Cupriavidus agavae]|uniref:Uncharacterized protein n=1 Tax=Cupriavidus agavae TaxID=1001822 RepID=A0A4V2FH97_9BURK|nr:hypothetical protein [Cupriavidus agavae]RZT39519.1 hypothetical protein EV147_2714 [Cupriavidus agavae]